MSKLVIAEKPSVAQSIAKVIGVTQRKNGYMEGNGYIVSWCVGHLIELAPADRYNEAYSKWRFADLPIFPDNWLFNVTRATKKQFDVLKKLMMDSSVDSIVCATDAGREGELIFRLVYNQCNCKKPMERLWISSMEDSAIKKAFDHLLDSRNYDNLYEAALCRAKADWLVGINATRLFSTLYNKTMNVGRVMTPTLAMMTEREQSIVAFTPEAFYNVVLDFGAFTAVSEKFKSKPDTEKIRTICNGKSAVVTEVIQKEKVEKPPKLYDLTTLQREANRLYGYTAYQTLEVIQTLYEKKLTTYPRTDSRYLTEEMKESIPDLVRTVSGVFSFMEGIAVSIEVSPVIDSSKVSDHHAIIPTKEVEKVDIDSLPTLERSILCLIATRLLTAVGENHVFSAKEVVLHCGEQTFFAKGKTILKNGFKEIEKAFFITLKCKPKEEKVSTIPELGEGAMLENAKAELKEGKTSPPKHFTEDTLLSAMENASSEDFAKIEDLERAGLGTPATRASIIEKLVSNQLVERKNKSLIPTEHGIKLAKIVPDAIKSAKLTAEWETNLQKIEVGELTADSFMNDITNTVQDLVKRYEGITVGSDIFGSSAPTIGQCPRCGKKVVEIKLKNGKKGFVCESGTKEKGGCGFALWENDIFFTSKQKILTREMVKEILKNGKIYIKDLFSEKKGILYNATVHIDDDGGKFVKFKLEFHKKSK